jgi:carboxyl-terminal processing protease
VNSIQKLTKTTSPGLNGLGIDVYNAEKILRVLGYTVGQLDATLDSTTFKAIKDYQKKEKLTVTGKLDSKTQNALNADLEKIIVKYDKQYNTAVQQLGK